MGRTFTIAGQCFAAVLLIVIGLGISGCQDTASVSAEGQLASLSVTPGGLDPAFSSDITTYTVDVSTADTSVTVRATPRDGGTTMTINGQDTSPGEARTIALPQPTTNIIIVLTAPSRTQNTYVVIVRKVNNDLSALSVTPGSLAPAFVPGTLNYTTDVDAAITSVTVSATKTDPNAVMSGAVAAGAGTATGQATIPLGQPGSSTVVSITVTASNGISKTYRITVSRVNNNLSALSVTPGVLIPAFAQSTLNYTVTVGSSIDSVAVSATKADSDAVMSGSVSAAAGTATGQATIPLGGQGTTTAVSIIVTAPNGDSKTYRISVNRATPGSENALSALSVTPGALVPAFSQGLLLYTVTVGSGIDSVTLFATKADPSAVMSGSVTAGAGTATGQATIPLNGPGTITIASITVTAPNGTPRTYAITIARGFR
ncbi:MAG: cadherin-like beta sandwich domain-containing protein [Nitrospira sp.]